MKYIKTKKDEKIADENKNMVRIISKNSNLKKQTNKKCRKLNGTKRI